MSTAMSVNKPNCVFCGQETFQKIIKFTSETIKKCTTVLEYRRSKPVLRKSRCSYDYVEFSDDTFLNDGYHAQCYKLFTAIKIPPDFQKKQKILPECDNQVSEEPVTFTETQVAGTTTDEAEVSMKFEQDFEESDNQFWADKPVSKEDLSPVKCFICERKRKKHHGREVPLAVNRFRTIDLLKSTAKEHNDIEMFEKISSFSEDSTIFYHKCCKDQYLQKISKGDESDFVKKKKAANTAYFMLCEMLEDHVVKNNESLLFDDVKKEYQKLLVEQCKLLSDSISRSLSDRYLEKKILDTFHKKIKIIYVEKKKFLAPFLNYNDMFKTDAVKETICSVARQLREEILNLTTTKLPEDCTDENLIREECDYVPELLTCFLETLILGDVSHLSRKEREKLINNDLTIFSLGQDLVYAASNHKIKTSKHPTLGLAVKNLCNSKEIIDLLSKYGHCCSYNVLEELETEFTLPTANSTYVCPEDALSSPDLNTTLTYDNIDCFVETPNDEDPLQDTVGINNLDVLQNENPISVCPIVSEIETSTSNETVRRTKRKRQAFDEIIFEIQPVTKKIKIETWNQLDISALNKAPENLNVSKQLDVAWMLSHMHRISDISMWEEYHSYCFIDNSTVQQKSFLTPINDSPTYNSTVLQTLELNQEIARECQAPYIQITYDLAIVRTNYCIPTQKSPKFDNIFIDMGAFHIEMTFFKAVGTFIEECGLTNIMTDCNLIAKGSVAGFIDGKNYNKCKQLHSVMALTLQQLHFESFLENKNLTIQESVLEYLTTFVQHKDSSPQIKDTETQYLIQSYDQYTVDTLEGKHGKTAKFYAMYIDFINLYHLFVKSIKVGDFDLYCYALGKVVCLFFYYNQNYSRWLLYYLNQLQHVDKTNQGFRAEIAKGSFGRSRILADLTMEQTINGEAARQPNGIVHLTNSIAADVHPDQMKKHRKKIEVFLNSIQKATNPFSSSIDKDKLYNIFTGQATTPEVENSLLNAVSFGTFLRDQFIMECNMNSDRFHKPLKKYPVLSFASLKKKIKIGQKEHEVELQRDLFGRLLAQSLETNVDLEKVLCFPITSVPLSLCHIDGSVNKNVKSVLVQELEKKIDVVEQSPHHLDFVIVDGFFLLNTFKQIPRTFGDLSKKILQSLVNYSANRVAIVFDRFFTPSIKDCEHALRGISDDKDFYISGPQQTRTADLAKDLKNVKFKEALIKFCIDHWADQEMATIISDKTIYLSYDLCYVYSVTDNKLTRNIAYGLSCPDHEEAATKAVYFACQIKEDSTVTIRTSETDIVVIMLANMEHLRLSMKIWIDLGVGNARRYIDVSALYIKLGPLVSQALPTLHALTGCDFNPAFNKKGKKKPFDILMNSEIFQKAFADLGSEDHNIDDSFKTMESFVCHLYGLKKLANVNRARIEVFNNTYKVSDNVRNYDACNLPPCQSELRQHLLRTRYIASLWRNAHNRIITDKSPTDFGWTNVDGKLEMTWFVGNQLPEVYEDVVITSDVLGNAPDSDTEDMQDENDRIEPNFQYENDSTDDEE